MRFRDRDADRLQRLAVAAELARRARRRPDGRGCGGQELGRRVATGEVGNGIEVLVVQRAEDRLQHLVGAADVDHDAVVVERVGDEGGVDDEGRAMQGLRGAEHRAPEGMGDHDVIADFDCEHEASPRCQE